MTSPVAADVYSGLVDPERSAFFANQSQFAEPEPAIDPAEREAQRQRLEKAALGIAAAFVAIHHYMRDNLKDVQVQTGDNVPGLIEHAWRKIAPLWLRLAVPAIAEAYALGTVENLNEVQLHALATDYAVNLGVYVNTTSAEALTQGFNQQLSNKWSERVAWSRAVEAYGLDKQQMKTYIKQVMAPQDGDQELVPVVARMTVERALIARGQRLGDNEAFHASKIGESIVWLTMQKAGNLPDDIQKEWVTADDERVCPVCGPLHKKRVGLNEQWVTEQGERVWAPGLHPRCRCEQRLSYPEIHNDPWQMVEKSLVAKVDWEANEHPRGSRGRFRSVPARAVKPVATAEPVNPEVARVLQDLANDVGQVVEELSPFVAQTDSPFLNAEASPFISADTSPFTQTASPFVGTSPLLDQESPFKRVPGRKRLVLVFKPGAKEPIEEEVEDTEDEGDDGPYWTFWNSVREANPYDHGDPWGETRDTGGRNDTLYEGQVINFDFNDPGRKSQPVVVANQYDGQPHRLVEMAADTHYGDIGRWVNDPTWDSAISDYDDAWYQFHETATANMAELVEQMSDADITHIFSDSSVRDQQFARQGGDVPGMREILVTMKDSESPLVDAALRYIQAEMPSRRQWQDILNRDNGAAAELLEAEEFSEAAFVPPGHIPTILVFDDIHGDTYRHSAGVQKVVRGKYRIKSIEATSANFFYRNESIGRPRNIEGWNVVHLEPIGPDEEEVPDYMDDQAPWWLH